MNLQFPTPVHSPSLETLRREVRDFLADALRDAAPADRARSWFGFDAEFSRQLGRQGWIGMTWPREYGGHGRSTLERYVVLEELLAAGAPVAAHWTADRQSGPQLLRYGTESQRRQILPRIAAGECYFCIGMSEPNAGSDLAAIQTRARQTPGGWIINGTKIWTSQAHRRHYMILLCRTSTSEDRRGGMSQMLVDLSLPGITIRPILNLAGEHHFNEVVFQDCELPHDALLGQEGDGWKQVTGELGLERSGPERFLTTYTLLDAMLAQTARQPDEHASKAVGMLVAELLVLRRMSFSVAGMLQDGRDVSLEGALVKDLGASFEQAVPEAAREACGFVAITKANSESLQHGQARVLAHSLLHAPASSIYGGTREILRGILARGLGLR
jgi:alkylation response protein AidB-like acyl-CoA dehydrogenase